MVPGDDVLHRDVYSDLEVLMGRMWFHKNKEICPKNCGGLEHSFINGFYCSFYDRKLKTRLNRDEEKKPVRLEKCKH